MRAFFRAVILVKSLIAVAGLGWVVGFGLSGAKTPELAQNRAILHHAAYVSDPSEEWKKWEIAP